MSVCGKHWSVEMITSVLGAIPPLKDKDGTTSSGTGVSLRTDPEPKFFESSEGTIYLREGDWIAYWVWLICGETFAIPFRVDRNSLDNTLDLAIKARNELVQFVSQTIRAGRVTGERRGPSVISDNECMPSLS